MAIDPNLIVIKPVGELAEQATPAADNQFLLYDGTELKKSPWANVDNYIKSGYLGTSASVTDITGKTGFLRVIAAGTYFGTVVTASDLDIVNGVANNRVILDVVNGAVTNKTVERVKGDTGAAGSVPVVQTTGTSTTDAMSQKAVTDEINEVGDEIYNVTRYADNTLTPFQTGKYIYTTGAMFAAADHNISGLITLKAGEKITVYTVITKTSTLAIGVYNGSAFQNQTSGGQGVLADAAATSYEFTATVDCQVAISYKTTVGFKALVTSKSHTQRIVSLEGKTTTNETNIATLQVSASGDFEAPVVIAESDKHIFATTPSPIQSKVGFSYSKPISVRNGDKIKLTATGNLDNSAVIARVTEAGLSYVMKVRGLASGTGFYEWIADEDCEIAVSFITANGAKVVINRGTAIERLNKIGKEPVIVAPYHDFYADGTAGSIFNAETVTAQQIDDVAQKIQKDYSGYISREVIGKDASGIYDIPRYILTKRNYFAYKNKNKLHAWKAGDNSLVYTDSYTPVPADAVYSDGNRTALTTVTSYNSTNSTMVANGVSYVRSKADNIDADIIYLDNDLYEYKVSYANLPTTINIYGKNENLIASVTSITYNDTTRTVTYNSKNYVRAASYDYGKGRKHTIVLWGNEHGPTSDPMEPAITLLSMMRDLGSSTADSNPLLKWLKYNCKIVIIPVASPYGVTMWATTGREGRTNFNGVNLNRNYDYKWENSTGEPKGASAGDQVETRYMMDTCSLFDAALALDIHCLGQGSYINRLAYDAVLPITGNAYLVREMKEYYNKYVSLVAAGNADNAGWAGGFINHNFQIAGGLIEMNAGVDGVNEHSVGILQMNYDYLLKSIRLFLKRVDNNILIS